MTLSYLSKLANLHQIFRYVQSRTHVIFRSNDPQVQTAAKTFDMSHVISTIPLAGFSSMLLSDTLPHLTGNPSSSVTVVNLVFDAPADKLHPPGFGYLIPRAE